MLVPTSKCNIRCIFCERVLSDSTLPFENIKKIFPLFPYLECIEIQGGEPFLIDYFKELFLKLITFSSLNISILTNGLLIDKEWADLLVRQQVSLFISIDSVDKYTYEYIRRGARFEDLLKNIHLISELRGERNIKNTFGINAVILKCNYKEIQLFPEFCNKYGFNFIRFDFLRPRIIPEEDIFTVGYNLDALNFIKDILPEIEMRCRELNIEIDYGSVLPFLNLDSNKEMNIKSNNNERKICSIPWKKLFIDSDGTVRPDCICVKNIGNLNKVYEIEELWNSEIMQNYRNNIIKKTLKNWCSDVCLIGAVDMAHKENI